MSDLERIRDWADAMRIAIRESGGLTEPTYAAGMKAGMLQAVRQLELLMDRLAVEAQLPTELWRITSWDGKPPHEVWEPATYAELFQQVVECSIEVVSIDPVAPGLVKVRAIDGDVERIFPIVIILEEVAA